MGHRHKSAPNRGSLGFRPRAKAKRESARWRNYPAYIDESDQPVIAGFAGYKVGMTHVIKVEEKIRDPRFKQEKLMATTVIELPLTRVFGLRLLKIGENGHLQVVGEVWHPIPSGEKKDFRRSLRTPDMDEAEYKQKLEALKSKVDSTFEVRLLMYTLPRNAGFAKKKPDIIETKVGGKDIQKNFDFAVELMGKEFNFADHFKEGDFIDVTSVTKGKGFSGAVKRHGVKIMPRKKRKGRRVVGSIGAWHPARTPWTVPRPGQMGYHQRTEYNKKILKYSENPRDINPKGGWKQYGVVRSPFVLIEGSIPGPAKRLIRVRKAMRKPVSKYPQTEEIKLSYISTSFNVKETEEEVQ